jgi:amidohydrolase
MASTDELYFTVKGKGTHAAQPHLGIDPIVAASHLVLQMQTYISRFRNPLIPAVLSIASFQGGNTTNIIPDTVNLKGTLRSFDPEWRKEALDGLETFSKDICRAFRTECEVKIVNGYPALVNDEKVTALARQTAQALFGQDSAVDFEPKMWAEDFAYYAQKVPSSFWFLGVRPSGMDEMPALHNSGFSPSEDAMVYGTSLMVAAAVNFLK